MNLGENMYENQAKGYLKTMKFSEDDEETKG
jgi:hypothetical protein